jgi:hypothetical protein
MKMNEIMIITEDYVSFEVAKLLKEKGFDEPCIAIYEDKVLRTNTLCDYHNSELSSYVCAPTYQGVMKWLRIKHNLSIEVYRTACGYVGCIVAIPSGTDIKFLDKDGDDLASGQYTKWEYACEATIKDCLENLETLI